MVIILRFLNRIIGLKHIKFLKEGIFFSDFPMFLIPLEIYEELNLNLEKELGKKEYFKILKKIGFTQSIFSMNYFKNKYNIFIDKGDYSFYLEQTQSIGIGKVILNVINRDKIKVKWEKSYEKLNYDPYLEGLLLGSLSNVFENKFNSNFKNDEFNFEKNLKQDIKLHENYSYNNVIIKNKLNQNIFLDELKKKYKNIFYSNEKGTFFMKKKKFFTLISVLVLIYYLSIEKNKKIENVFENVFEKLGKEIAIEFKLNFQKKKINEIENLFAIYGFNGIEFAIFNKTKLIWKIHTSNFEIISKKLKLKKVNDSSLNLIYYGLIKGFSNEISNNKIKKINLKESSKENFIEITI